MARANFNIALKRALTVYHNYYSQIPLSGYPRDVISAESVETTVGTSRRKPTGFLNPTAYSYYYKRVDHSYGTARYTPDNTFGGWGTSYSGQVGSSDSAFFQTESHFGLALSEVGLLNDGGLRNAALIAVRNKLKSTDINLGVAFGERNQTARLLGDTTTRLASAVRHLRRGQIRRSMDELGISSRRRQPRGGNVPRAWLELQYGWKPLLSDVYGAATALEKRPKGDWRVTAKVTRKAEGSSAFTRPPHPAMNFDAFTCEARWLKSVYARIDALPQNEAIISLASLGVLNPLSVAWELVPYSFVVDWFIPIGGWLESLDALLGYGQSSYSSSLLVRATWNERGVSGSGPSQYGGKWITDNRWKGRKTLVSVERQVSSSVPLPSLPSFKDPRSLGHMANGLALLATAFGRR